MAAESGFDFEKAMQRRRQHSRRFQAELAALATVAFLVGCWALLVL